jgi:hypothetical protein
MSSLNFLDINVLLPMGLISFRDDFGGWTLVRAALQRRSSLSEAKASRGLKPALHDLVAACDAWLALTSLAQSLG